MDYARIYDAIIKKRVMAEVRGGAYMEKHHIWPRSLSGDNSPENLVRLTAKEHYIVHHLLTKIFSESKEMATALWFMCQGKTDSAKGVYVSPRVYAEARENFSKARLGKTHSAASRQKISAATGGENNPMFGRCHSEDAKRKNSEAHKGLQCGEKHGRYDHTQYVFQHAEHGERYCTKYELRTEFSLVRQSLSDVCRGKRKTTGGWRCLGIAE